MDSTIGSNTNSPVPLSGSPSNHNHSSRPTSSLSSTLPSRSNPLPPPSPSRQAGLRNGIWKPQAEATYTGSVRNGIDGAKEMNGCIESDNENQDQQEGPSQGLGDQVGSTQQQGHPSPFLHLPHSSVATPRSTVQAPASPAVVSPQPSRPLASSPPPSHSHTPSTRGVAAFDFDELLGPRPSNQVAQTSSSSNTSQPASSDEGHQQQYESQALEGKLQGLGFASPGGGKVSGVGEFREGYFDEGEETDESWLHYSSSSRRGGGRHHDGTSTASHHPSSSNTSDSPPSQISSPPNPSANSFGSPLSPHVTPFSPGLMAIGPEQPENGKGNNGSSSSSNPWATPSANIISAARAGAREREASWNSANLSSPPSESRSFASPALHATFATTATTESHTSSTRSYSPFLSSPPLSHRYLNSDANSLPFPHPSNMPFTPPSSHPESFDSPLPSTQLQQQPAVSAAMSQRGSRDTLMRSPEKGGYSRAPYSLQPTLNQLPPLANIGGGGGEPNSNEEISTLFVTGFPDDMLEREFQNVFLFAEGFEAATLKIHTSALSGGDGSEGSGSGINSGRTSFEEYGRDEFLRREACASPALNGNGMNGGSLIGGGKKQSIGFARFRTQQQAFQAMEVLNRRKVDLERGSLLKAEMAKKNLHPKKQVFVIPASTIQTAPLPPSSSFESNLVSQISHPSSINGSAPSSTAGTMITTTTIPGGGGPSIPLSALDADTLQKLANSGNVNPAVLAEIARQNAAAVAATSPKLSAPVSTSTGLSAYEAFHSVPSVPLARRDHQYFDDQPSPLLAQDSNHQYSSSSTLPLSASPPRQSNLLSQNSMLQQFDDRSVIDRPVEQLYSRPTPTADTYSNPSPLLASDIGAFSSIPRERQASYPQQHQQTTTSPGLAYESSFRSQLVPAAVRPQTQAQQQSSQLAQQQAQLAAAQAFARNANPADMNAPKNTLYVGGLPAVLPSLTGPFSASHLEDSLRNAFSRCPGFKRLQFRSKSNGPIVFVEFEDTAYATKAMNEMYGYILGGLVKGGIRLSYSKNPLGVRSNGLPSGNPPPLAFVTAGQIEGHQVIYPSYIVPYS
ncbi:hypothetical protein JCM5353_002718, partial [Sporobolomyces roseus]